MTTLTVDLYVALRTPSEEENERTLVAHLNRMHYVGTYTGEHGNLLPVGTRVRVRPDVMTTRSKSVRFEYVDTGTIVRVVPRVLSTGKQVYEYPYMIAFDDGADLGGYASWELETVDATP